MSFLADLQLRLNLYVVRAMMIYYGTLADYMCTTDFLAPQNQRTFTGKRLLVVEFRTTGDIGVETAGECSCCCDLRTAGELAGWFGLSSDFGHLTLSCRTYTDRTVHLDSTWRGESRRIRWNDSRATVW